MIKEYVTKCETKILVYEAIDLFFNNFFEEIIEE